MKKSKVVNLVLVAGVLGTGGIIKTGPTDNSSASFIMDMNGKRFSGAYIGKTGYYTLQDSSKHSSGSSSFFSHNNVRRGGWGIFGHHAAAS